MVTREKLVGLYVFIGLYVQKNVQRINVSTHQLFLAEAHSLFIVCFFMSKTQIIHIHGGTVFDTREKYYRYLQNDEYNPYENRLRWRDWLKNELGETCEVFLPSMPAKQDADYVAWKIWFEKLFSYITDGTIVLIGHSLGTIFLTKYLSENSFPKPITALHLVGSVFDGEGIEVEDIGNFALQPEKLPNVTQQINNIHLYHSRDDDCSPWKNVEKYVQHFPDAHVHAFQDRGHFTDSTFPELLEEIRKELSLAEEKYVHIGVVDVNLNI